MRSTSAGRSRPPCPCSRRWRRRSHWHRHVVCRPFHRRRCPIDLTRDQFQLRARITGTGLIDQTDPSLQIQFAHATGVDQRRVVVSPPSHALRLVADLCIMLAAALRIERPYQGWLAHQSARQCRKFDVRPRVQGQHRTILARQDQSAGRRQQPPTDAVALFPTQTLHHDLLAKIALQQFLRIDEIILVVLFDHACTSWIGQRGKTDRRRIDPLGHIAEAHFANTLRQRHFASITHQGVTRQAVAIVRQALGAEAAGLRSTVDRQRIVCRRQRHGQAHCNGCRQSKNPHGTPPYTRDWARQSIGA